MALHVVDVGSLNQKRVIVSASDMSKAIAATACIAFYGILLGAAKLLQSQPSLYLQVVGHTDSQGVLEANIALSKRRTEGLTSLMASAYGVAAHRVSALGVAELATVASNNGEEGRAKNRRMELVPR